MVHENGQYTKQTSAWMQAKTAQTYFEGNIFFNGPRYITITKKIFIFIKISVITLINRAGVNINDGFGGGNELYSNVMFNQVRETYDHGPFNSWDRGKFYKIKSILCL